MGAYTLRFEKPCVISNSAITYAYVSGERFSYYIMFAAGGAEYRLCNSSFERFSFKTMEEANEALRSFYEDCLRH
jgi:hypothetical protein